MSKWGKVKLKVLERGGVDEQKHMVNARRTRSRSHGDKIKDGRMLASMMMTTCTSSTAKRLEIVRKLIEIWGAPMPETESAIQNDQTS